jgi:hypothetical protein
MSVFASLLFAAFMNHQAPSPPANCSASEYRQFDFWLGDWEVFGPDGRRVGHNTITSIQQGCALMEHWVGAAGGSGTSLNFYDRSDRQWHQAWIDNVGGALRLAGGFSDGRMMLESADRGTLERITWTPTDDRTVRQLWQASKDGGKTWTTSFDGKYVRAGGDAGACDGPEFHRLDFWVGEWNVQSMTGEQLGHNRIIRSLKGCAIEEHWSEPTGEQGQSLFYYLPDERRWKQVWVTESARRLGGVKEKHAIPGPNGAMRFQGELRTADGVTILDRTTLLPQPEGTVRQIIETSRDGGTTWKLQFDAIYHPVLPREPPR